MELENKNDISRKQRDKQTIELVAAIILNNLHSFLLAVDNRFVSSFGSNNCDIELERNS